MGARRVLHSFSELCALPRSVCSVVQLQGRVAHFHETLQRWRHSDPRNPIVSGDSRMQEDDVSTPPCVRVAQRLPVHRCPCMRTVVAASHGYLECLVHGQLCPCLLQAPCHTQLTAAGTPRPAVATACACLDSSADYDVSFGRQLRLQQLDKRHAVPCLLCAPRPIQLKILLQASKPPMALHSPPAYSCKTFGTSSRQDAQIDLYSDGKHTVVTHGCVTQKHAPRAPWQAGQLLRSHAPQRGYSPPRAPTSRRRARREGSFAATRCGGAADHWCVLAGMRRCPSPAIPQHQMRRLGPQAPSPQLRCSRASSAQLRQL